MLFADPQSDRHYPYQAVRRALEDVLGTAVYTLFLIALEPVGLSLLPAAVGAKGVGLPLALVDRLVVGANVGLYRVATGD